MALEAEARAAAQGKAAVERRLAEAQAKQEAAAQARQRDEERMRELQVS